MDLSVHCRKGRKEPLIVLMDGEVPAAHFDSRPNPCGSNSRIDLEFNFDINRDESNQSDVRTKLSLHT